MELLQKGLFNLAPACIVDGDLGIVRGRIKSKTIFPIGIAGLLTSRGQI